MKDAEIRTMTFKNSKTSNFLSLLLCSAVFLMAFEQVLWWSLGIDTEFKPYRLLLILGCLYSFLISWKVDPPALKVMLPLVGVYVFGVFLSVFWSGIGTIKNDNIGHTILLLLFGLAFFWVLIAGQRSLAMLTRLQWVVFASFLSSSVLSLVLGAGSEAYRMSGLFRNPNHFAYMVGVSILIATHFLMTRRSKTLMTVLLIGSIFWGLLLIAQSGSRTVLLTIVLIWPVLVLRYMKLHGGGSDRRIVYGLGMFVAVSMSVVYFANKNFLSERVSQRFDSDNITSSAGRIDIWRAGFLAAEDYNYLGLGLGGYKQQHLSYVGKLQGDVYSTVTQFDLGLHSEYMVLFVEIGIIGLALYIAILFLIWRAVRHAGRHNRKLQAFSIQLEALLVFDLVFGFSQSMYLFPYHWIVLGFCVSFINIHYFSRKGAARARPKPNKLKR